MENCLTLEELIAIVEAKRELQSNQNRFLAGIQGIDLGNNSKETSSFDDIQRKAKAALSGVSEDKYQAAVMGFEYESDD